MADSTKAGPFAKEKKVVIYDPETETLSVIDDKKIQGTSTEPSVSQMLAENAKITAAGMKRRDAHILPRFDNHYEIFEDEDGLGRKSLVARVDLSRLGLVANTQRRCGLITRLYVVRVSTANRLDLST